MSKSLNFSSDYGDSNEDDKLSMPKLKIEPFKEQKVFEFDSIFCELGEFGKFQKINYFFICLTIIVYGQITLSYVFTTGNINYRCNIEQCEDKEQYLPLWLSNAIPYENGIPSKCLQYQRLIINDSLTADEVGNCSSNHLFNTNNTVRCDHFIYETIETTIVNEFNLQCEENDWKRTIVGSVNNAALFICLPLVGLLSDKFGRKRILILGIFFCGIIGILKSISPSYELFLLLEFLDAGFGSGTFMCAFVLSMEMVGPKRRTLSGTFIMCCYSVGLILLAIVSMKISNFRIILQIIYTPGILLILLWFILPESSRWLISMGRHREAIEIIRKAAKINNVCLSDELMQDLYKLGCEINTTSNTFSAPPPPTSTIKNILQSKILIFRTIGCCFCWLVNAFVAYGLTLNSVDLGGGNKYENFILINAIEIPAYILTYFLMNRISRRWSLCGMMLISGFSCFTAILTTSTEHHDDHHQFLYRLILFLIGKFTITASFNILYVYTAEICPTQIRNSFMNGCSMIARIGSMMAPQTPLLEKYMTSLPLLMYGSSAIMSAILVLYFPETFNTKLPDTVEDALNIDQRKRQYGNFNKK